MKIGVFCSGGDSPGMNPCVRAIVRTAISQGHEIVGINRGYDGLLNRDFYTDHTCRVDSNGTPLMSLRTVSDWSKRGGAVLRSSRSERFRTEAGLKDAAEILQSLEIDAIIPIGGNGTAKGANQFQEYWNGKIVCLPGTIDNDLKGTDFTIGFSTAVNTAVEAVDKIRDTADSHDRMFLIEVMGRHSGFIGVTTALACGAEVAAVPETDTNVEKIVEYLHVLKGRGKTSVMMVVSEGDEKGGAFELNEQLQKNACPFSTRVVVLGHLQRGGNPTAEDRVRATQLGSAAVAAVLRGETGVMVGLRGNNCISTPLPESFAHHNAIPQSMITLLETMAQ